MLKRSLMAVTLISILALTGCKKEAAREMPNPVVTVQAAAKEGVSATDSFIGKIDAAERATISARVSGFVEKILVAEGNIVKKDQPLIIIEKKQYVANVAQAKATLAQAKSSEHNARLQKERGAALLKSASISQARYDDLAAAHDAAVAAVSQAEAALIVANLNLSYTTVTSPVAGKVGFINYKVGETVSPSLTTPITTVIAQEPMYVVFSVSDKQLQQMRNNYNINNTKALANMVNLRLKLSDGTFYKEIGKINFIDNAVSGATDSVLVRGEFKNPDGALTQGQTVSVYVESKKKTDQIVIPQSAVLNDVGGKYVMVAEYTDLQTKTATPVRKNIVVGDILPGNRQVILEGLKDGDVVIVEGTQKIRPNTPVTAVTHKEYQAMMQQMAAAQAGSENGGN